MGLRLLFLELGHGALGLGPWGQAQGLGAQGQGAQAQGWGARARGLGPGGGGGWSPLARDWPWDLKLDLPAKLHILMQFFRSTYCNLQRVEFVTRQSEN